MQHPRDGPCRNAGTVLADKGQNVRGTTTIGVVRGNVWYLRNSNTTGPADIVLSFRAPMEVRSSRAKAPAGDRPLFQGTAAEVLGDIQRYQALGVSHMVFDPVRPELRPVLDNIARFAEEVRPKLGTKQRGSR